jgi:hypothetical protein
MNAPCCQSAGRPLLRGWAGTGRVSTSAWAWAGQEALGHEQWVRKVATGMRRDSALLDELLVRAILV